jgi:hypothetical protein
VAVPQEFKCRVHRAVALLDTFPRAVKTFVHTEAYIHMHVTTLSIIGTSGSNSNIKCRTFVPWNFIQQ